MLGLLTSLAGLIIPRLIPQMTSIAEAFARKEITREEMQARMHEATMQALSETAKANADALSKTFDSFMVATAKSRLMQIVWGTVTLSQLGVLLWHQVGIPAYVHFTGIGYPSSGTTVEWAYLLLAGCLGLGPMMLKR